MLHASPKLNCVPCALQNRLFLLLPPLKNSVRSFEHLFKENFLRLPKCNSRSTHASVLSKYSNILIDCLFYLKKRDNLPKIRSHDHFAVNTALTIHLYYLTWFYSLFRWPSLETLIWACDWVECIVPSSRLYIFRRNCCPSSTLNIWCFNDDAHIVRTI